MQFSTIGKNNDLQSVPKSLSEYHDVRILPRFKLMLCFQKPCFGTERRVEMSLQNGVPKLGRRCISNIPAELFIEILFSRTSYRRLLLYTTIRISKRTIVFMEDEGMMTWLTSRMFVANGGGFAFQRHPYGVLYGFRTTMSPKPVLNVSLDAQKVSHWRLQCMMKKCSSGVLGREGTKCAI